MRGTRFVLCADPAKGPRPPDEHVSGEWAAAINGRFRFPVSDITGRAAVGNRALPPIHPSDIGDDPK